jgi:hypothetical protein
MSGIVFNDSATFGVTPLAVVSTDVKAIGRPTNIIDKDTKGKELLKWGENNDFPQKVIEDVRKNPELGTLLDKQANLLYSAGLEWGYLELTADGKEILKPAETNLHKTIKDWCRKTSINRYLLEASKDIYWFYNAFIEIVLSNDRSKIAQVCVQAAEECRFGPQNKKGLLDTCFINAHWPNAKVDDAETKTLPVIDPYYDPATNLKDLGKGTNFIYPLNYANPGNKFYQLADWNSIRESGWLEVSSELPKLKKALLKNQTTIKYHIKISSQYWALKYKGFELKTISDQTKIKADEIDTIQKMLTGSDNAGKNFWSVFHSDLNMGKDNELIKIEAIDDKIKDGKWLEDGKDASIYTMSAVGLHPALVGTMPNNGLGGAGSNIREAYNLHILTNKSRQDLILEPLNNLVVDYNGWTDITFRFKNQFMTTLDTGTETSSKAQISTSNTSK